MSLTRRALLPLPALLALPARAQAWPTRPVQIIIGYAPGTGIDNVARFYAEQLRAATGQGFVVVNRVGAFGNLAAGEVARAAPDGATLLITPNTPLTVNPLLMRTIPFDPQRDLTPVAPLARWGFVLLVNPEATPVATLAELTALMRTTPGGVNYASGNLGGRIAAELYRQAIGVEATHVGYRSVPAAMVDLLAGRVSFMFSDVVAGLPQVRAGRLRALAVTEAARIAPLPDVPTLVESGVPHGEVVSWFAALLPGGARPELQTQAHAVIDAVTRAPATRAFLANTAAEPIPGRPELLSRFIREEHDRWRPLIAATGITLE